MRKDFYTWLMSFVEEKNIETGEFVASGVQVADVVRAMIFTSTQEQQKIKRTLVAIDFKNGDVLHYFKHLAQAL